MKNADPSAAKPLICICICTYKRPALLQRLLDKLTQQEGLGSLFEATVVVADNDREETARAVVQAFANTSTLTVGYWVQPVPNIATTRNLALQHATGEYLAFIDDDEFPITGWLKSMLYACQGHGVAGVLGPVLPHFDDKAPG